MQLKPRSAKHHGGTMQKSLRLKKTLPLVLGRGHTNFEIQAKTGSMAVHTDVDDLRKLGWPVKRFYQGLSENGRKIQLYRVVWE